MRDLLRPAPTSIAVQKHFRCLVDRFAQIQEDPEERIEEVWATATAMDGQKLVTILKFAFSYILNRVLVFPCSVRSDWVNHMEGRFQGVWVSDGATDGQKLGEGRSRVCCYLCRCCFCLP